ncbi:Midasin [Manis pentadactyla]|nr:Midasin [Manis pentadactyla]
MVGTLKKESESRASGGSSRINAERSLLASQCEGHWWIHPNELPKTWEMVGGQKPSGIENRGQRFKKSW